MKSSIASINNIQLHFLSAGHGKLVLFLHGFPEFSYAWKKQLDEFSRDYFVVAPDLRGFNLSSAPASPEHYQMPCLIEDIRALIAHLGFERCILVGHDWGGMIACCFAAQYPSCVEKLVMICAPHPAILQQALINNPAQHSASSYLRLFRDKRAEKILSTNHYDYLWNHFLSEIIEQKLFDENEIKRYETSWEQPQKLTGGLNYYRAWSAEDDFTKYKVLAPTLFIWGEKDRPLLPCLLEGVSSYFIDFKIKKIAEGSHWLVHEAPEIINLTIREFIQ